MAWMNSDGLYLEYGTEKTSAENAGDFKTFGALRCTTARITLASLSSANSIIADNVIFPDNARIERVEVVTLTASTGSTAPTLNVGFTATSRSTEVDYDGLVAVMLAADMSELGEITTLTAVSTLGGALIGTTTTVPAYLSANNGSTTSFGSGVVDVRVYWHGISTSTV